MKRPTFSICIPNYNYAAYVGETIRSALGQTYPHFEIIVADNASTDESVRVIKSIKDRRVRLIENNQNIGLSANLQVVASHARNEYMLLLSSDDRMLPNALEMYSQVLADLGTDAKRSVLYSYARRIDGQGQPLPHDLVRNPFYETLDNHEHPLRSGKSYVAYKGKEVLRGAIAQLGVAGPFLTMAYPRVLFDAVNGYSSLHSTDPDVHFTYKVLSLDPIVAWIREPLFEYRVHGSNQADLFRKQVSIKKPIDKYLHTLEVPDTVLADLGLTRGDLIRSFVTRYCVNESIHYLAHRGRSQSFKGITFAMATYPSQTLRTPRAYLLAALLMFGPLAPKVTRVVRDLYRWFGGKD